MKTQAIIKTVTKHKGSIFVEVSLLNDILLVQVSKAELLFRLKHEVLDNEAEIRAIGTSQLVFGRSYGK